MSSKYTKYDHHVAEVFCLFGDLRVTKDVYSVLFEKNLHPNSENAFKAAKNKSINAIVNRCPEATPDQVNNMADVVLHLASQCKHVH